MRLTVTCCAVHARLSLVPAYENFFGSMCQSMDEHARRGRACERGGGKEVGERGGMCRRCRRRKQRGTAERAVAAKGAEGAEVVARERALSA